jgi:hypothetical protein
VHFDEVLKEHRDLYLFTEEDGRVIFKLMDYEFYKATRYIMQAYPEFKFDLEDRIWDDCVLEHTFNNGKDYLPAGIVTTVSQMILYLSCPQSIEDVNIQLEDARALLSDAREQAIITICEAFPSYLPENLEKMTWPILLRRLAQAEQILKKQFEFKNPTSQPIDDSDKIFKNLEEFTNVAVDFKKVNKELYQEEFGTPSGDFNLRNARGH